MKKRYLTSIVIVLLLCTTILTACSSGTPTFSSPTELSPTGLSGTKGCGDGICDGPENPQNCPQDCAAATLPTDNTPGPPTREPAPKCGDNRCDGPENVENCPQDCGGSSAATGEGNLPPSTGVPDFEPPINVFISLHIDTDMDYSTNTFKASPFFYLQTHDEIDWLMEEAKKHGLHYTILFNGWYPKWAMDKGELSQFETILDAGHEIGTHVHPITYDPDQDIWIGWPEQLRKYGRPAYDKDLSHQAWSDAESYVRLMLDAIDAPEQNKIVGPYAFLCSDEEQLMTEFGFKIAAGDRSEIGSSYFGHMVWNPWRPAANDEPGHEIEEDLTATILSIDHYGQIGAFEEVHPVDLSVSQLQRRFLMIYTEWLSRERNGAEDRVWSFGFVYHPNYTDKYHADLLEFLNWLDKYFIDKKTAYGNSIAQYATVGEIAEEFYAWEAAHPGVSSFSYIEGDPYPYTYAKIPQMLEDAAYERHIDLGAGVTGFRLLRNNQPIYLLWSDQGERLVDFSPELEGQVRVTNVDGEERIMDASAIPLTSEPTFIEPLR